MALSAVKFARAGTLEAVRAVAGFARLRVLLKIEARRAFPQTLSTEQDQRITHPRAFIKACGALFRGTSASARFAGSRARKVYGRIVGQLVYLIIVKRYGGCIPCVSSDFLLRIQQVLYLELDFFRLLEPCLKGVIDDNFLLFR